jgi:ribosomal protein S27E
MCERCQIGEIDFFRRVKCPACGRELVIVAAVMFDALCSYTPAEHIAAPDYLSRPKRDRARAREIAEKLGYKSSLNGKKQSFNDDL